MSVNKSITEELDGQILILAKKLSELKSERDKAHAEELYNLVGRYFKGTYERVFEIIKVKEIHRFDRIYTIRGICLKHLPDFKEDEEDDYFTYYKAFDIPLYYTVEDSMSEFTHNYKEISKEEFNSLLKEAFKKYSNKMINETI